MKDQVVGIELEKQLTSLRLSRELKKLGVRQDSVYLWIEYPDGTFHVELTRYAISLGGKEKELFAAFTVAEHGKALPQGIYSYKFAENDYRVWNKTISFSETKEADARAKMRIYLIKEGIIEVKKDV